MRLIAGSCLIVFFSGIASAQTSVEIFDGRIEYPWIDYSSWDDNAAVDQAREAARAHWRAADPDYEEEFRVLAVSEGSFTRPGGIQHAVLYLMSLWPRCCPRMGLAVIEDGRLIRNFAFDGIAQELQALPDLDSDGLDELAYIGSFGMGGDTNRSLTVLSLTEQGVVDWGTTSVFASACAAGYAGSTASRILAHPGPAFLVEHYTQETCESEEWKAVSGPEPLDLYPSGSVTYVDLAVQ